MSCVAISGAFVEPGSEVYIVPCWTIVGSSKNTFSMNSFGRSETMFFPAARNFSSAS
jgi:hypothetical protein